MLLGRKPKHFDHIVPDGLGGKPVIENCMVLCVPCHNEKTVKEDRPRMQKADNVRQRDQGLRPPPTRKMQSRGFQKKERNLDKLPLPDRRGIYQKDE